MKKLGYECDENRMFTFLYPGKYCKTNAIVNIGWADIMIIQRLLQNTCVLLPFPVKSVQIPDIFLGIVRFQKRTVDTRYCTKLADIVESVSF